MWWQSVKELIEYAKGEKPDPYKILEIANRIAAEWKASAPPTTSDETIPLYVQIS